MFSFNLFTSKTFWSALVAAITAETQLDWSKGFPLVPTIGIVAVFVAALGVRDAIATTGAAAVAAASTASVAK